MRKTLTQFFVLLLLLMAEPQPAAALLETGSVLPALSGETLEVAPFDINSLKDKRFILKLGTTWCGTCSAQVKEIGALRDFLKEQDILYIDVFIQENAETVRDYFKRQDLQLPDQTILDSGKMARQLNVYLIPRLIIVDKGLKVVRDGANLNQAELKKILSERLREN